MNTSIHYTHTHTHPITWCMHTQHNQIFTSQCCACCLNMYSIVYKTHAYSIQNMPTRRARYFAINTRANKAPSKPYTLLSAHSRTTSQRTGERHNGDDSAAAATTAHIAHSRLCQRRNLRDVVCVHWPWADTKFHCSGDIWQCPFRSIPASRSL